MGISEKNYRMAEALTKLYKIFADVQRMLDSLDHLFITIISKYFQA